MSDSHIMCVIVLALSRLVAALHVVTCRYMSLHSHIMRVIDACPLAPCGCVTCRYMSLHVVTCLRHVLQHVCLWSCLHAA